MSKRILVPVALILMLVLAACGAQPAAEVKPAGSGPSAGGNGGYEQRGDG